MKRVCACGAEFESTNVRRTKCHKDCGRDNRSRNRARTLKRELTRFVGIDGEGVTREDGTHDYVLLSVGDKSLFREDGERLHWREIFPFLYECFTADPDAAYVGFFLGYDFTHWVRTLHESRAASLLTKDGIEKRQRKRSGGNPTPFPVHIGDWEWECDILGNKRFKLRPGTGYPPGTPGVKNTARWMIICDVGSFFQMSFLRVIKPEVGKLVSPEDYDVIEEGKTRRSTASFDAEMIRYNVKENHVLSRVVAQLNDGFKAIGITLRREQWFGPGQAAQEWMKKIGAPDGETVRKHVPKYARDAARQSYYGGWFEIFRHGIVPGTSYEYDINSAYPYMISRLPCLLHGQWTTGGKVEIGDGGNAMRLLYGVAEGSDEFVGALLYRTNEGRVLRPSKTAGWYWEHEVIAARNAGILDTFDVSEHVAYIPCDCPPPFREIESLYLERLKVGKDTPHGKAYKLIYNSAYGKMAQSVGNPTFANPIYASLITAGCRTMILDAIATHPKRTADLLMVATDGIYFRSAHPNLPIDSETLGKWDGKPKDNLTLFMPGIYWDDKARELVKDGKAPSLKSRGINAMDLAQCIDMLDVQFQAMVTGNGEWPTLELPIRFDMVTATQALARGKWETCGNVSTDGTRVINSDPKTKRAPGILHDPTDSRVIMTWPYDALNPIESTPYERRFGEEMSLLQSLIEGATPDGTVTLLLPEMLNMR